MKDLLLSCDWGTSSFRLRLVNAATCEVKGEIVAGDGIAAVYNRWKHVDAGNQSGRENFYFQSLQQHLAALANKTGVLPEGVPVVISGMASSSIGIRSLPYASLPFAIDGSGAMVEDFAATRDFHNPVKIISGATSGPDIMRGEETQMIGLAAMDSELMAGPPSVCIFPGTHSKHVRVENGRIVDFTTFMTGELFDVLRRHSILKDSIAEELHHGELTGMGEDAFRRGVLASARSNLLHTFFSVRVDQLFERVTRADNLFYLSGLLIGTELRTLCGDGSVRIRLCSGSSVYHLYQLALESLGLAEQAIFIAPEIMDRSAMEGHISIFKKSIA